MRRTLITILLLVAALGAQAADRTEVLLARAWPSASYAPIESIGDGVGLVFTPDLSVKNNCRFFEAMGFACFESADWLQILADIQTYNIANPERKVRTLVIETHGTNGHGLKVQRGKNPEDDRSYIAVAALEEMLAPVGVKHIILSACNSGRLLRPEIYRKLDRNPGDKLFLPATLGIVDATDAFDPKRKEITVITPATSRIETTVVGSLRELAPSTRKALEAAAKKKGITLPKQFAVSEMLIQMLLRSPELQLRTGAHVVELSKVQTSAETSERLFREFVRHLDFIAAREHGTQSASASAAR